MMSYFTLEVYVHDVVVAQGVFGSELAYRQDAQAPYALSFQFLDYPLLLVYAGGEAWTGVSGPIDVNSTVYNFSSGKSCVFQADAGELAFLVEQVPMYVSLLNVHALPKPSLLAYSSTPILISQPSPYPHHAPGSGLPHAAVRTLTLFTSDGVPAATARVACRLTDYGAAIPPVASPTATMSSFGVSTGSMPATLSTRPHTAPHQQQTGPNALLVSRHSAGSSGGSSAVLGVGSSLPGKPAALFFANSPDARQEQGQGQAHHQHHHAHSHHHNHSHSSLLEPPHAPRAAWASHEGLPAHGQLTHPSSLPHSTSSRGSQHVAAPSHRPGASHGGFRHGEHEVEDEEEEEQQEFDAIEAAAMRAAAQARAEADALAELETALAAAKAAGTLKQPGTGGPYLGRTVSTTRYGSAMKNVEPAGKGGKPVRLRPGVAANDTAMFGAAGAGSPPPAGGPSLPLLRALLKHSALSAAHEVAQLQGSTGRAACGPAPAAMRTSTKQLVSKRAAWSRPAPPKHVGSHPAKPGLPLPLAPISLAKGLPARKPTRAGVAPARARPRTAPGATRRAATQHASVAATHAVGAMSMGHHDTHGSLGEEPSLAVHVGFAPGTSGGEEEQGVPGAGSCQGSDPAQSGDEGGREHMAFLKGVPRLLTNMASFASQPGLRPEELSLIQTYLQQPTSPGLWADQQTGTGGRGKGNTKRAGPAGTPGKKGPFVGAPATGKDGDGSAGPGTAWAAGSGEGQIPLTPAQMEAIVAAVRGAVGANVYTPQGFVYPQQHGPAQAFQMSSVLMWEVMSMMTMRSVLSSAIGAMHTQMGSMAQQVVAHAVAPAMGLTTSAAAAPQQQLSASTLAALQALLASGDGNPAAGVAVAPNGVRAAAAPATVAQAQHHHSRPSSVHFELPRAAQQAGQRPAAHPVYDARSSDGGSDGGRSSDEGAQAPPPQMARAPTMRISLKPPKASAAPLPPSPFSRSQQQSPRGGSHSGSAESVRSEEGADDEARQGGAAQQAAAAQQAGWVRSSTMAASRTVKSVSGESSNYDEDFEDVEEDIAAPTPRTAAAPVPQPRPIPITRVASGPSAGAQMNMRSSTGGVTVRSSADLPEIPEEDDTQDLLASTISSSSSQARSISQNPTAPRAPVPAIPALQPAPAPQQQQQQPARPPAPEPGGRQRSSKPGSANSGRKSGPGSVRSSGSGSTRTSSLLGSSDSGLPLPSDASPVSRPSRRTADDGASLGRGLKARKSVAISEDVSFLSASEDLSYTGSSGSYHHAGPEPTANEQASSTKPFSKPATAAAANPNPTKAGPASGRAAPQPPASASASSSSSSVSSLFSSSSGSEDLLASPGMTNSSLNQRLSVGPPPANERKIASMRRQSTRSFMVTASDLDSESLSVDFSYDDDDEIAELVAAPSSQYNQYMAQSNKRRSSTGVNVPNSKSGASNAYSDRPRTGRGLQQPSTSIKSRNSIRSRASGPHFEIEGGDDYGDTAEILAEISDMSDDDTSAVQQPSPTTGGYGYGRSYGGRY